MKKMKLANPIALLIGVATTIIICAVLIAAMAKLTLIGKMGEGGSEIYVSFILLVSTAIGSLISLKLAKKQEVLICILHVALLILISVTVGFMIDGVFENILLRIGSILAGEVLICILSTKTGKRQKRKNRRYR